MFADRLLDAIAEKGSPICVGIDPIFDMLPDDVAGAETERDANDAEAAVDAIFEFTIEVLQVVAPYVPCVKFQSAYFEKYLWEGVEAYFSLIHEAKALDLLVIGRETRGHRRDVLGLRRRPTGRLPLQPARRRRAGCDHRESDARLRHA